VLIGLDRPGRIEIQACIAGANAEEAGAHVTFTQDTWEHIYQIKDQQYPNDRIVGWYHSHPGFGVFLSDHDTFIHKNFFASPGQVAWVYDPHSDEEGCFGWADGRLVRLSQVTISDRRGGERVPENAGPEPSVRQAQSSMPAEAAQEFPAQIRSDETEEETSSDSLLRLTTAVFSYLTVLLLGFLASWYLFPRFVPVPVPVDPMTGRPLPGYSLETPQTNPSPSAAQPESPSNKPGQESAPTDIGGKENHGGSK
jgi:proteasome lid subunit RPN8/RPN11